MKCENCDRTTESNTDNASPRFHCVDENHDVWLCDLCVQTFKAHAAIPREDDPKYRQDMKDAGRGHLLR